MEKVKIRKCPFCGKKKTSISVFYKYYVLCENDECEAMGPEAPTEAEAIERWNAAPRRKKGEAPERDGRVYIDPEGANAPPFETWEASALVARIEAVENDAAERDEGMAELLRRQEELERQNARIYNAIGAVKVAMGIHNYGGA